MQNASLLGGFENAPLQAATGFRAALNALAHPGQIHDISGAAAPAPMSEAAATLLLTLCDPETPLYLAGAHDCQIVRDWITFHIGAPLVGPEQAAFAVGTWAAMPVPQFPIGTAEYPDRSTTLIVEMAALEHQGTRLTGPGIKDSTEFALPETAAFARNAALYPLGLDFYFTAGAQLAGLPRSTQIHEEAH